jgi:hypothetical protein
VVISLITLGLLLGAVAFVAYWKGYAHSQRQVRWLHQELLRAERIADQMKDSAMDAELALLVGTGK